MPETPEITDQQLVEAARRGEGKAFEALVQKYQGMVFKFLYHFMGSQSDAEDLTQETFVNLYRKLDLFNPSLSFKSWVITMARNLAISFHRRQVPAPIDPEILSEVVKDTVSGPEGDVLSKENVREVQEILAKLPDEMREVLIMRYLLDFPLQKVAETLNIPEGTAKSRAFQARTELRNALIRKRKLEGSLENG